MIAELVGFRFSFLAPEDREPDEPDRCILIEADGGQITETVTPRELLTFRNDLAELEASARHRREKEIDAELRAAGLVGRVVHVDDGVPGAVYIGRANRSRKLAHSPVENRYKIGIDGDRDQVIRFFTESLLYRLRHPREYPDLGPYVVSLRGKPLACWCRHDGAAETEETRCHGDVLLALLELHSDEEIIAGKITEFVL